MKIIKNIVSLNKYNIKCPYKMESEFYVVHNTANDGSARNEINYMINNNSNTSFHYAIDDVEIVQGIEENRNSWNAGDGTYGNGNRKGISIEICYSKSGGDKFVQAEKNTAKFIADGLKAKGWSIDRVKKHQDFNGKYCPHRTLDLGWQRFLDMISAEMGQVIEELGVEEMEQIMKEINSIKDRLAKIEKSSVVVNKPRYTVTALGVNVRQKPSFLGKVVKLYNVNQHIFEILEDNGQWIRCSDGWIKKSFVKAI